MRTEADQIDVFICYRQTDGHDAASWLHENLDGALASAAPESSPDAPASPARLKVYFDQSSAAVSDWTRPHLAALETAKVFLLVCTPGAYASMEGTDFVREEIDWWLRHRSQAPLLIDATGEGGRWIPRNVRTRWPNAQRVMVRPGLWQKLADEERDTTEQRVRARLLEGIAQGGEAAIDEELQAQRARNARLSFLLFLATALLGLAVALGWGTWRFYSEAAVNADVAQRRLSENYGTLAKSAREDRGDAMAAGYYLAQAAAATTDPTARRNALIAAGETALRLERQVAISGPIARYPFSNGPLVFPYEPVPMLDHVEPGQQGDRALLWNQHGHAHLRSLLHADERPVTFEAMAAATFQWLQARQLVVAWGPEYRASIANQKSPEEPQPYDRPHCVRVWTDQGQLLHDCLRHDTVLNGLTYEPRHDWLIGFGGRAVRIWDVRSGRVVTDLPHGGFVTGGAVSPDGARMVTVGQGEPRLWDLNQQRVIGVLTGCVDALAVRFSGDSQLVAGLSSTCLGFWNGVTGRRIAAASHDGILEFRIGNSLAFPSARAATVAVTLSDRVEIWDPSTGTKIGEQRRRGIHDVQLSPDGTTLAIAHADGVTVIDDWSLKSPPMELALLSPARYVRWTAKGEDVVVAVEGNRPEILLWSVQEVTRGHPLARGYRRSIDDYTILQRFPWPPGWSADGRGSPGLTAAPGTGLRLAWTRDTLFGWAALRLSPLSAIRAAKKGDLQSLSGQDDTVHVDPRRLRLTTLDPFEYRATEWDPRTLTAKQVSLPLGSLTDSPLAVRGFKFLEDGALVLWGGLNGTTGFSGVWDTATQAWTLRLVTPQPLEYVEVSPNRARLLGTPRSQVGKADRAVEVWDLRSKQRVATIPQRNAAWATLSKDGRILIGREEQDPVVGTDGSVQLSTVVWLYDIGAAKRIYSQRHPYRVRGISLTTDGTRLLVWGDAGLTLWDLTASPPRASSERTLPSVTTAILSDDGNEIVYSTGAAAALWSGQGNAAPIVLRHEGESGVQGVRLSDGTILTLGTKTVRRWTRNGEMLTVFPRGAAGMQLNDVRGQLLTWTDSRLYLWDLATGGLMVDTSSLHAAGGGEVAGATLAFDGRIVAWTKGELFSLSLDVPGWLDVSDPVLAWEVRTGLTLDALGAVRLLEADEWQTKKRQLVARQ